MGTFVRQGVEARTKCSTFDFTDFNKRLCYCRGTARRATSVEILWPFF